MSALNGDRPQVRVAALLRKNAFRWTRVEEVAAVSRLPLRVVAYHLARLVETGVLVTERGFFRWAPYPPSGLVRAFETSPTFSAANGGPPTHCANGHQGHRIVAGDGSLACATCMDVAGPPGSSRLVLQDEAGRFFAVLGLDGRPVFTPPAPPPGSHDGRRSRHRRRHRV